MDVMKLRFYRGCFIRFDQAGVYVCRLHPVNGAEEWVWTRVTELSELEWYMCSKPYATPQYVCPEDCSLSAA